MPGRRTMPGSCSCVNPTSERARAAGAAHSPCSWPRSQPVLKYSHARRLSPASSARTHDSPLLQEVACTLDVGPSLAQPVIPTPAYIPPCVHTPTARRHGLLVLRRSAAVLLHGHAQQRLRPWRGSGHHPKHCKSRTQKPQPPYQPRSALLPSVLANRMLQEPLDASFLGGPYDAYQFSNGLPTTHGSPDPAVAATPMQVGSVDSGIGGEVEDSRASRTRSSSEEKEAALTPAQSRRKAQNRAAYVAPSSSPLNNLDEKLRRLTFPPFQTTRLP